MKNLTVISPVVTDAITGAFGGAVIGDAMGGSNVAIVTTVLGAMFMVYVSIHNLRQQKKDRDQQAKV